MIVVLVLLLVLAAALVGIFGTALRDVSKTERPRAVALLAATTAFIFAAPVALAIGALD